MSGKKRASSVKKEKKQATTRAPRAATTKKNKLPNAKQLRKSLSDSFIRFDPKSSLKELRALASLTPIDRFPYLSKWKWHSFPLAETAIKKCPVTYLLVDDLNAPTKYLTTPHGVPSCNRGEADKIIHWRHAMGNVVLPPGIESVMVTDADMRKKRKSAPSAAAAAARGRGDTDDELAEDADGRLGINSGAGMKRPKLDKGKRRALIIGNSKYQQLTRLDNATNDSVAMRTVFRDLGYDVYKHKDAKTDDIADTATFKEIIDAFSRTIEHGDMVAFYYAGHAGSTPHGNILLALDAQPLTVAYKVDDYEKHVSLEFVHLKFTAGKKKVSGFSYFTDACRTLRGGQSRDDDKEEDDAIAGMSGNWRVPQVSRCNALFAFPCSAGEKAKDSDPDNVDHGLYTSYLMKTIKENADADINAILRKVTRLVDAAATRWKWSQRPQALVSIHSDFYGL